MTVRLVSRTQYIVYIRGKHINFLKTKTKHIVRYEVLAATRMKMADLWDDDQVIW